jgi:DNA-binding GntR family transcriptional regulator
MEILRPSAAKSCTCSSGHGKRNPVAYQGKAGAAALVIHRIGYGASGNALEDAMSWYRGDRYEYIAEITG